MSSQKYSSKPSFLFKKDLEPPKSLKNTNLITFDQLFKDATTLRQMKRILYNRPSLSKHPRVYPKPSHNTEDFPFLEEDSGLHLSPEPPRYSIPQSPPSNPKKELDIPFLIYKHSGKIVQVSPPLNNKLFPLPSIPGTSTGQKIKNKRTSKLDYIHNLNLSVKTHNKPYHSETDKQQLFLTSCTSKFQYSPKYTVFSQDVPK